MEEGVEVVALLGMPQAVQLSTAVEHCSNLRNAENTASASHTNFRLKRLVAAGFGGVVVAAAEVGNVAGGGVAEVDNVAAAAADAAGAAGAAGGFDHPMISARKVGPYTPAVECGHTRSLQKRQCERSYATQSLSSLHWLYLEADLGESASLQVESFRCPLQQAALRPTVVAVGWQSRPVLSDQVSRNRRNSVVVG